MNESDDTLAAGTLWVCRHLALYARLVDHRDSAAIGEMIADARVTFRHHPTISGTAAVTAFYARAFAGTGLHTTHLPSFPVVTAHDDGLHYEAPYLRIVHPDTRPLLDGAGIYRGLIAFRGAAWSFENFRVDAS